MYFIYLYFIILFGFIHSEDLGCRISDNLFVFPGYLKVVLLLNVLLFRFANSSSGSPVSTKMSLDAPTTTGNAIDVHVHGSIAARTNGHMYAVHLGPVTSRPPHHLLTLGIDYPSRASPPPKPTATLPQSSTSANRSATNSAAGTPSSYHTALSRPTHSRFIWTLSSSLYPEPFNPPPQIPTLPPPSPEYPLAQVT